MKVLVAGATGFLGRALVPKLRTAGHEVDALARASGTDLADATAAAAALSPWRWDAVVNLAGPAPKVVEAWDAARETIAAHVRIALGLVRAVPPGASVRFVHASGMIVYGMPETRPIAESHPRRPIHAYGLAKVLAEDVVLGLPGACALRLPGLFAEDRRDGALYHFLRAAREGRPIRVTSPIPLAWDVMHVDDAAQSILLALAADPRAADALNVSYGEPVSLPTLARAIARRYGKDVPVEESPDVVHPIVELDTTLARTRIGWSPPSLWDRLDAFFEVVCAEGP